MSTVTVTHYGVSGTGRTVTEAKRDAGRKIERMMDSSPQCYCWRGYSVVFYQSAEDGAYFLIRPDNDGRRFECCSCSIESVQDNALRHLLDSARIAGEYELPDWLPAAFVREHGRGIIANWKRNDAFQAAYRHAQSIGAADPHSWACDHDRDPQFAVAA